MDRRLRISLAFGEAEGDPKEIQDSVILADKLGFEGTWLADHFMPWIHSQNQSPFVWSLMASCLERTDRIKIGPLVTTPVGGRYHPALIAQASATLDNMYKGRFRLAVGTGEAINEAHFPLGWPPFQDRMGRLVESVALIRKLWQSGDYFDFEGDYFPMRQVFLYTKPRQIPPIYFSSLGPKSAFYAGKFGDHLLTQIVNVNSVRNNLQSCKTKIFPSFEAGAKAAGKDPSKMEKAVVISLAFSKRDPYLASARKYAWLNTKGTLDESDPRKIERIDSSSVTDEDLLDYIFLCSNWDQAVDVLAKLQEMGISEVAIYMGKRHETMKNFSKKVLPHFR